MRNRPAIFLIVALLALVVAGTATAGDAVKAKVTALEPTAAIIENGNADAHGTYAIGTIQVFYTYVGYKFPETFGQFQLDLMTQLEDSKGQGTVYPANITLSQSGKGMTLTPETTSFWADGTGWQGGTVVNMSIPATAPSFDGAEVTGNLQIDAKKYNLNTTTTIQVHILLAYPTSCLKFYNFVTGQEESQPLSSLTVNTNGKKITGTAPYPQLSDDVLVVNTCGGPESFDLAITPDTHFVTNPSADKSNAVFTYFTTGQADVSTFNFLAFGDGTPQGQTLQLTNITLPAGDMFLATVHMEVDKSMALDKLPATGTFDFSAHLYVANTLSTTPVDNTLASPTNPATASLTYSVVQNGGANPVKPAANRR